MTAEVQKPLAPATGRDFVTLTSWAGGAAFTTTPVADDQIEGDSGLTLNADGTVTGADGTYTLRHIIAATGQVEAISYQIGTGAVATLTSATCTADGETAATGTVDTDTASGDLYVLASANAAEDAATIIAGGLSQAVTAIGTQNVSVSGLDAGTEYYLHYAQVTDGNNSNVVSSIAFTTDTAPTASSATTTVAFSPPTGKSVVTLATGFDYYIFQKWSTQPVVGEQIVFTDSELTIDSLANITTDTESVFDVWFIALDGTTTATTVDTTGLATAADTAPGPFTVSPLTNQPLNEYVEFEPIEITGVDAGADVPVSVTGAEYAVDTGSGYGAFTSTGTNAQLGYFVKPRILTSNSYETETTGSIDIGGETSTLSATTVPPVIKRTGKQRAMVEQAKSQMKTLPPKPSNIIIVEE